MPIASLARRARLAPQAAAAASGPSSIASGKLFARNGYSIVKLETRGGVAGYGEGAPIQQSDFEAALARVKGRKASAPG